MGTHQQRTQSGFTYLELIAAGIMMAVLASIAVPLYRHHVLRSNRAVAKAVLVELASRQEAYALEHGSYAGNLGSLLNHQYQGDTRIFVSRNGAISESVNGSSIYEVTLLNAGPASFDLAAQALGAQAQDLNCQSFTLNSKGQRRATTLKGNDPTACWQ